MPSKFFTVDDMRAAARRRMPGIMFDYVDGAAGDEVAAGQNRALLERIRLQPRVLLNVENRSMKKNMPRSRMESAVRDRPNGYV